MSRTIDRRPNWNDWTRELRVSLVEAVALSLAINPDSVEVSPQSWMVGRAVYLESEDFQSRLSTAERHRGQGGGLCDCGSWASGDFSVPLGAFAAWAKERQWTIPDELAALIPSPHTAAGIDAASATDAVTAQRPTALEAATHEAADEAASKIESEPAASQPAMLPFEYRDRRLAYVPPNTSQDERDLISVQRAKLINDYIDAQRLKGNHITKKAIWHKELGHQFSSSFYDWLGCKPGATKKTGDEILKLIQPLNIPTTTRK